MNAATPTPSQTTESRAPADAPAIVPDLGLDTSRVRAITLDLDDTLWPIWPAIARAEDVLQAWLNEHAPATAALCAAPGTLRELRNQMSTTRPDLVHDMSGLRRESIRLVLQRAGDDPALAEPAFEVFFAERHRVELFDDALPALEWLSSRYPVVAVSNGNADVHRVGIGAHFRASLNAHGFGAAKPDARIFHAAAQAAGVEAEQVLHIGDDAHLDGVGALQAGMQLAWVNREGHAWAHAPLAPHITVTELLALCRALG
ncbi:HAD-IA family hydrolase [Hydrogenophaga taeniospiralis]|nr:HAD-IA family hydrolase [Hydrogenophaga taeniospiralis]